MSVKAMTWAWEQDLANPGTKLILVALADHADGNGVCWPGHELVAEKTGLSRQTVVVNIKLLEGMGLVTAERTRNTKGRGVGKVRYFLNMDRASRRSDGEPSMSGNPTLEDESLMSGNPTLKNRFNVGSGPSLMSGLPLPYKDEPKAIEPKTKGEPFVLENPQPDPVAERWEHGHQVNCFEQVFWMRYPKRIGKQEALAAWLKLHPDDATLAAIKLAIRRRLLHEEAAKAKGEFVPAWPDPKRWLAKRRWEDVLPAPIGGSTGNNRAACIGCGAPSHSEIDGKAYCRACDPFGREQWARQGGDDGRAGAR